MLSVQMEQRVNLKFLVKLGKTFTEVYKCTGNNYYPAYNFLNDLNRLKRDGVHGVPKPTAGIFRPPGISKNILAMVPSMNLSVYVFKSNGKVDQIEVNVVKL
ncbi:hypothetical protein NQ318_021932 [Aromia moschata]|uniref:Uncharacterized protein n=1 Tax=Aromia moschata TaxID=1265417 RepID=A0AAV8XDL4_9CUCU|nr:hypothetical protein NQ318_021932 [Aromia moschata]